MSLPSSKVLLDSTEVAKGAPCNSTPTLVKYTSKNTLVCLYPDSITGLTTLYEYNMITKELNTLLSNNEISVDTALNLTEQLRRERMRNFSKGINFYEIVSYTESGTIYENRLMIPSPDGSIYIYDNQESYVPKLWCVYDGSQGQSTTTIDTIVGTV
jgi:hypothetical protein